MLKPCPFCGNDVCIEKKFVMTSQGYYYNKFEYDIHCEKCGCRVNLGQNSTLYVSDEKAKENAIYAWNRRAFTEKYWQRT